MANADRRIRRARWSDREAIAVLVAATGARDAVADGDDPLRSLAQVIDRPEARAMVVEQEGRIVGYAELLARANVLHDCREGVLAVLAIERGGAAGEVGGELVDAMEREAGLLGCDELVVETTEVKTRALARFRRLGFREDPQSHRFRRRLVQPDVDEPLAERFLAAAGRAGSAALAALGGMAGLLARAKEADLYAEEAALVHLLPLGLPVVSEESGLFGPKPAAEDAWIAMDPLDATRNFQSGLPPWAISIGLVWKGSPRAGLVADLSSGRRWLAARGMGVRMDGPARARSTTLLAAPSRPSRPVPAPPALPRWAERIRVSGCITVDLCHVADGALGGFLGIGGTIHPQDLAGPWAVLEEAGGTLLGLDGRAPELTPDPNRQMEVVASWSPASTRELLDFALTE